jgi:hypothetical protein
MATVQHLSGITAAPGSINRKKMWAFPVARQLWAISLGIQTACCGGTCLMLNAVLLRPKLERHGSLLERIGIEIFRRFDQ